MPLYANFASVRPVQKGSLSCSAVHKFLQRFSNVALAILVWPELLAYLVAGVLLFAGIMLIGWSVALRQAERRAAQSTQVQYRIY